MADKKSGSKWDSSGSEDEGIKKTIESVVAIKKRKLISEDATFDKSSTNLNNLTPGESIDNTSTTVSPKPPSNEQTDLVSKSNVVLTSPLLQLKTDTDDTSAILKKQVGTATSSSSLVELSNDVDEVMINRNPLFYGCRSVDEYVRLNFIDQGTYGVVFRARCKKSNKIYALKQVKIGRESSKVGFPITALRETNILLALRHKNIVYVREMVVGTTIDKVYMVMDYGGLDLKASMDAAKKPFSTAEVKQLMCQFLSAVDHMHSKWYIHRDLKTSNLLYLNGVLRVCDFGLARKYGSPIAPYTFEVVTLWYRPTELLLGSRTYSTPLDMWSVGCILSELLMGKPLFPGEGEIDQMNKIIKLLGIPNEETWPGVTSLPNASRINWKQPTRGKLRELFPTTSFSGGVFLNDTGFDLLVKLLAMDPKQRISASDALKHPWLTTEEPLPTSLDMMPKIDIPGNNMDADKEEEINK